MISKYRILKFLKERLVLIFCIDFNIFFIDYKGSQYLCLRMLHITMFQYPHVWIECVSVNYIVV